MALKVHRDPCAYHDLTATHPLWLRLNAASGIK